MNDHASISQQLLQFSPDAIVVVDDNSISRSGSDSVTVPSKADDAH